jgi:DNA helicase-2/ATP-dependent DNA helicase PcrA
LPSWLLPLDESQRRAVQAGAGVVQAIAPAASGKTAVLVARAKELVSLGAPANRILCLSFNRAAAEQLRSRLNALALDGVEVRSFHALGRAILKDAELLRGRLHATTFAEWRWLAREAMQGTEDGVWIEPADAQDHISQLKLAELVTAGEYNALLSRSPPQVERTVGLLYELHEQHLERSDRNDFDDLIAASVRLLREDAEQRRRWQDRYAVVLVDEYQDIEPAQELLVRLLTAPEDALFCVGDEDQCIYAWRRASVGRIIDLASPTPASYATHSRPSWSAHDRRLGESQSR